MSAISIERVTKRFGEVTALQGASLTLREGTVTCLMGPSGSGKTTLLYLLLGLLQPDEGRISGMEGVRPAVVFQEDRLCERLGAIANVLLVCDRTVSPTQAEVLLERLALEQDHLRRPVTELSGGMRRRVVLARALLAKSDLLLLDEPFKGLDEETRAIVSAVLLEETAGKTLLVITHDPKEAELLDAGIVLLDKNM